MKDAISVKKSDVGPVNLFKELEGTNELVANNYNYNSITDSIKSSVDDIFSSYLDIGKNLNEMKSKKLYTVNEYKTIYEYSLKEFELSKTTTKSLIAIFNRFCDEYGSLKDDYKGFTYSNLVELLSVDDKDIKLFIPTMSVKAVRSKKLELQVNKDIEKMFNKTGVLTKIIDTVLNHDWAKLVVPASELKISHKVKKDKFVSYDENLYRSGNYYIIIEFKITREKIKQLFDLKIDFRNDQIIFNSNNPWIYKTLDNSNQITEVIDELIKNLRDDRKFYLSSSKRDEMKTTSSFKKLISLGEHSSGIVKKICLHISTNVFTDYHYENKYYNDNHILLYAKEKKNKKSNPLLFELVDLDDISEAKIINCITSEETKLFSDVDKFVSKNLSNINELLKDSKKE